ncbi:unnamed protein product [Blepharisma stoltei]|uniref:carnosine N-methyltransferase n=1 Tax=Blepharisma stoltei TaxID=1481888 RepID=A0AAU9J449_9CILI|nr:unnamed protein product [Blepharisma stoltei]
MENDSKFLEDPHEREHFKAVCGAFFNYQVDSLVDIFRIEKNFSSLKPEHLSKLKEPIEIRTQKMKDGTAANYYFLTHIVHPYIDLFSHTMLPDGRLQIENLNVSGKNISKVRSTLRQLVRDWAIEGEKEREMCFTVILDEIKRVFPNVKNEEGELISILTPGAGLGRLSFEIAKHGYKSQGNEFSYFMLLVSDYILNNTKTSNQFTVFPFIHDFSNVFTLNEIFRPVKIPDICPGEELKEGSDFSMVAGDFIEIYSQQKSQWDCIVTCFFMDTANNIMQYIEIIYEALKPGGAWINFGPLLYHYSNSDEEVSIDLTWEEFRHVILQFGFTLENENTKPSWYAAEANPMLEITYKCIFFTAIKPNN